MQRVKPTTARTNARPLKLGFLYWNYTYNLTTSYCADLFFHFMDRADKESWELEFLGSDGTSLPYPPLDKVVAGKFDAFILNGIWDETYIGKLARLGRPMVAMDYQPRGSAIDAVIFDGHHGGSVIAQALVRTRQPDVLYVSRFRKDPQLPKNMDAWVEDDTSADRRMGMQAALVGTKIEMWPMLRWAEGHLDEFIRAFNRLVSDYGRPPGVIATHDMPIGNVIWRELEKLGYRLPQQIGFITFDSKSTADKMLPPSHRLLSAAEYDWNEMASRAWDLLYRRLKPRGQTQPPAEIVHLGATFSDHGTVLHRS